MAFGQLSKNHRKLVRNHLQNNQCFFFLNLFSCSTLYRMKHTKKQSISTPPTYFPLRVVFLMTKSRKNACGWDLNRGRLNVFISSLSIRHVDPASVVGLFLSVSFYHQEAKRGLARRLLQIVNFHVYRRNVHLAVYQFTPPHISASCICLLTVHRFLTHLWLHPPLLIPFYRFP